MVHSSFVNPIEMLLDLAWGIPTLERCQLADTLGILSAKLYWHHEHSHPAETGV
jgi:hypothetical protein